MLLNKEYKVSSNFWSLFVNPLGNSLTWLSKAGIPNHSCCIQQVLSCSFGPPFPRRCPGSLEFPPDSVPRSAFAAVLHWRLPGLCSRLPEPRVLHAVWSSLFQLTRSRGPALTSESSPLARQHIPQPGCVTVSISIQPFPAWGCGGTTNFMYLRV